MEAELHIVGDEAPDELADLYRWLTHEREFAGRVDRLPAPLPETGLGAVTDVVVVALGSGGAGVALAQSLRGWLSTRRRTVSVQVKTDKGEAKVDATNVATEDVLRVLERILSDGDA